MSHKYKVTFIDMNVLFQCVKTSHDQRDDWGNNWVSISHSNTCWHQRWLHSKNWVQCRWQYSFDRVMTWNSGDDLYSRDDHEWCQWLLVEQWDQEMTSNNEDDLLGTNHFETMTILFCTDDACDVTSRILFKKKGFCLKKEQDPTSRILEFIVLRTR